MRISDWSSDVCSSDLVSESIGITVGAASKLVDRLEREGLVARRPNPADRRSSLVLLTDAGSTAFTEASEVRTRALRELLDPDAAATATEALTVLLARLENSRSGVPA